MARKKGGNVIGFDPLAWMKQPEGGEASPAAEASPAPTVSAAPPAPAEPDAAVTEPRVSLGDQLTIAEAASLHQTLSARLNLPDVVLEAGAVRRVDAAGLQLLLAFVRERARTGTGLQWRGVSNPLREAASRLGLEQALHFD